MMLTASSSPVTRRIEATVYHLFYLPAYSQEFNPIGHAFGRHQIYLPRTEARPQEDFNAALSTGLIMITLIDAKGWLRQYGYALSQQPF
jgi:hypothetical protein